MNNFQKSLIISTSIIIILGCAYSKSIIEGLKNNKLINDTKCLEK